MTVLSSFPPRINYQRREGGFFVNRQTQVKNMKVRREGALLSEDAPRPGAELTELPPRDGWGKRLLRADKLVRNLAVVGAMLMTVVAVKNMVKTTSRFAGRTERVRSSAGQHGDGVGREPGKAELCKRHFA